MQEQQLTFGLPKPGRALIGAMVAVTAIWVFFAVGINFGNAGTTIFDALVGSDAILKGQVWRLLTSMLLHQPSGTGSVGHLLTTLFGLYFLGSSLEERWGKSRFILFLIGAGVFAAALQVLVSTLLPTLQKSMVLNGRGEPIFYGALGVVDAVAIAWALSFRGRQVRLFFVLPVSGFGLIVFVIAMNVLYVLAMETRHEGLVTPFGGILAGFLFAEGSPVRRAYLKWKLGRLQGRSAALQDLGGGFGKGGLAKGSRPAHLRVIRGGQDADKKLDKNLLN